MEVDRFRSTVRMEKKANPDDRNCGEVLKDKAQDADQEDGEAAGTGCETTTVLLRSFVGKKPPTIEKAETHSTNKANDNEEDGRHQSAFCYEASQNENFDGGKGKRGTTYALNECA